ncbi:ferrochelatase [Rhodosalinus sp.]|uniref:ferrochelatase n=1 Tax=Rhodosalinus sp. TaxID=2047741 RepID=UPI003977F2E4
MKKLVLAAALSAFAAPALAAAPGTPKGEVIMEPPVIVEETEQASTPAGVIIPLMLIALIAAVAD